MLKRIGKIVNTKGLRGEVKILSDSDFKQERFKEGNNLEIKLNTDNSMLIVTIEKNYVHKQFDILKFKEYNSIEEVRKFKGSEIFANSLEKNMLKDGEFFFEDIINLDVFENEEYIGKIVKINDIAGKTYISIKKKNDKINLVPFVDQFIQSVELYERINIKSIPGLLDD